MSDLPGSRTLTPRLTGIELQRWASLALGVLLVALVGGAYGFKTSRGSAQGTSGRSGEEALMAAGLDALYTKNDPGAAAARFREVLEQNPVHYGATYQLATALDRAGKPAEARPLWEKVLEMARGYKDQATVERARARLARNR